MQRVFAEVKLKGLTARNRLVRSATWEGVADTDGSLRPEALSIYEKLAEGGIGLLITGFTSVSRNDVYIAEPMRLCADSLIPQYEKLVRAIHERGCPVITQLALGGFYRRLAGSHYELVEADGMTVEEIRYVISEFRAAARRAQDAGFDGVQIHAAHFFFLSRFISPAVNHRTDAYGGSVSGRARILVEILEGIREECSRLHVSVKINSSDFMPKGLNEMQSLEICHILADAGIDSIEVSGNGTSVPGIVPHVNEGYFVPFAMQLAGEVSVPVIVVGGFRSLEEMESVLAGTRIALISLSRPLIRQPDLPRLFAETKASQAACISCNRCYATPLHKCIFV